MGYRGRLIWPFTAEVLLFNTAITALNGPDGVGFDHDFKAPLKQTNGTTSRVFDHAIRLQAQVETERDPFNELRMLNTGDDSTTEVVLVFHFQQLEDEGLVDSSGRAKIVKGSKLGRVWNRDMVEVDNFTERDVVVTHAKPHSFGLSGGNRNLLVVRFARRQRSTAAV